MKNIDINGKLLANMSLSELEVLYKEIEVKDARLKEEALKNMDTGVYDSDRHLINDTYAEEDAYVE